MQTLKTITLFATVSNSATSRTSKNGRNYTAFGVSILDNDRQPDLPLQRRCLRQTGPLRQAAAEGHPHQARRSDTISAGQHRHSPASDRQPSCGRFAGPHTRRAQEPRRPSSSRRRMFLPRTTARQQQSMQSDHCSRYLVA